MQANVRSSCLAVCADSLFNASDTAVGDDGIHEAVATVADEVGFAEAKAA
jgi:hypothetical protein